MRSFLVSAVMVFLMSMPAYAGWVQVDKGGDTTIISNGMIKEMSKGESRYTVLDTDRGNFMLVDKGRRLYAKDTIDNFCKSVAESVEKELKEMPKEARAALEKMRNRKKTAPVVTVRKEGDGGTIAGYSTVKYEILADGRPYQKLWLTKDADLVREMGKLYASVISKVSSCTAAASAIGGPAQSVEDSATYRKILSSGWEMKSITHGSMGETSVRQVVSLEKKNIPSSEFAAPAGYRKVPLSRMMSGR